MTDLTESLQESIRDACNARRPVEIRGGGSKRFFGRAPQGEPLSVIGHRGILNYDPRELVITARAGTPLAEVEARLAENGQTLPFEPPRYQVATVGGTVAAGLAGPRRPYTGAVRDFVLGARIINGRGEVLRFGGEVIKNVAGYDVSRAMAGALGTLGLLLEVSLRVLPRPEVEQTLIRECSAAEASKLIRDWSRRPLPITGLCHDGARLRIRLSGAPTAIASAGAVVGGEPADGGEAFWSALRDHRLPFFNRGAPLWRLSVPIDTPLDLVPGSSLIDWGGAQRWLYTDASAQQVREAAAAAGGHALRFWGEDRDDVFHPLPASLKALSRRLKSAFDPEGILNRGRLYADL